MSNLRDLVAKLRLDTTQFNAGLASAKGQATGLAGHMRAALLPVAAALGAAFSAQAVWGGIRQGAEEIDRVAKSARAVGGSIGGFRALELAAGESGVAVGTLREQVQNMDRQIAAGRADVALRALGLEAEKLRGLDVDQRLAAVADAMKGLELDTGSAMAILQNFGIENRDMALLMMQGGDALRAARKDVDDYGLALSKVDAAQVEKANDQLGRVAIVGQVLRQELAAGVMPALGQLAQAFTDSVREGGALRVYFDEMGNRARAVAGIFSNFGQIVLSLVEWMRGVTSEGGALGTVFSTLGSVITGVAHPFGKVLDIMASSLKWFRDLIEGAGGFGQALEALGDLAEGVWEGIKTSARAIVPALNAVWAGVKAGLYRMLSDVSGEWSRFLQRMGAGMRTIPGLSLFAGKVEGAATEAMGGSARFDAMTVATEREESGYRAEAGRRLTEGGEKVQSALARLNAIVAKGAETTDEAEESALRYSTALDGLAGGGAGGGGGGGKGSAGRASDAMKALADRVREMKSAMEQVKSTLGNAFVGLITGAKSLRAALGEVLGEFAKMLANRAFNAIWSNTGVGNLFGSLLGLGGGGGGGKWWLGGRSFDGGGFTGMGARLGGLDGKGGFPAILHPNETVIDHTRGQGMGALQVVVTMDPSTATLGAFVANTAGQVLARSGPGMISRHMAMARERDMI